MENFITKSDYKAQIAEANLNDMIQDDELILEDCESEAISQIEANLFQHYDTQAIFALTGNDRPKILVLYAKYLVLYELYKRLYVNMPESVKMDAIHARTELQEIAKGNKTLPLPRLVDESESPKTTRKFLSQPQRTH